MTNRLLPTVVTTLSLLAVPALAGAASSREEAADLGQVVVTATRTPHTLEDVPVKTIVITREDIASLPATNLAEVLGTVPGIETSMHDDVFGIYTWRASMRGLNFNDGYALVLIDGERTLGAGQSGGMGEYGIGLNQIPLEMVERIEIVMGPGSALYGSDAISGVINIITRDTPEEATVSAGATYGWYDIQDRTRNGTTSRPSDDGHWRHLSSAYIAYGDRVLERSSYYIHYGYEKAEDTRQDPIVSDRHAFLGKWRTEVNDNLSVFAKVEATQYEKLDYRDEDSYRVSAGLDLRGGPHALQVKAYRYLWDFVHGYPGYPYGYKHGKIGYDQAQAVYSWYAGDSILTLGGEAQQQSIDYAIEQGSDSIIPVDETVETYSLFAQEEATFLGRLTLAAGLRYDTHSTFGSEFNPKLSAMYRLTPDTTLRASVGRAFKSPTIRQLYYAAPYEHGSYFVASNPDLDPEIAVAWSASVEQWLMGRRLWLTLGYFRTDVKDLVVRVDTGETIDGKPLLRYLNVNEAWIQGVELQVKAKPGGAFSLTAGAAYTRTRDDDTGNELTYVPRYSITLEPACVLERLGLGASLVIGLTGRQYTDRDNTKTIDAHTVVDGQLWKSLSKGTRLTFAAKNITGSDKGDEANWRTGHTYLLKLETSF